MRITGRSVDQPEGLLNLSRIGETGIGEEASSCGVSTR